MRKSNCKEARRAVEAYVFGYVTDINERMEQVDNLRPVSAAFDTLKDEISYQSDYDGSRTIIGAGLADKHHRAGRYGFVAAITPYWVWWLACKAGEFAISYYDQREHVRQWLDETQEEADRYSNDDVLRMYCHMTAQAFERLYERENTPHRIPTADFRALYDKRNGGHYFDRETLRYYGQTMLSFAVYGFELVTDYAGIVHDCYSVSHTITAPTGEKFARVDYFDRETIAQVFPKEA